MKKFFITFFLSITMILSSGTVSTKQASAEFKDIPNNHPSYSVILEMKKAGFISGYPDGTFRPNDTISRKHVALLLDKALQLPDPTGSKSVYKDVPKNHPYYKPIMKMSEAGIMSGTGGKFNPDELITRIQLAKVLDLAFSFEASSYQAFDDVPESHWGYKHANALHENRVVDGVKGKFEPNEPVTREYYVTTLQRAIAAQKTREQRGSTGEGEDLTRQLSSSIEWILIEGVSQKKSFEEIRPELLKHATQEFTDRTLKEYYPYACNECDTTLFPFPTNLTSDRFEVTQPSANLLSVKTIELGNALSGGGFITYQLKKEDGTWKMDSYTYKMAGKQNFQLSAEEAKTILEQNYRAAYQNVAVKFKSTAKETGKDIVTGETFTYDLYLFEVKADEVEELVSFHSYNGMYDYYWEE
ncbi:S-layer homology domain-containing protein [Sporosarcina cyprini]|uniref:S-layer homology domain-containing protein n=1 Tax=Sporosarcina cyprini TaxID=2910523 RepID=UPI001EDE5667|nr:S-layer homology domain-containing protein [Sporosarcina cyprini]MCG3088243.1 S-layer homology domain-containing protein [Sporosarcina cyprini]